MPSLNPEDLSKVLEILEPLNKDPVRSDSLNPMAKLTRKIKGLPELPPEIEESPVTPPKEESKSQDQQNTDTSEKKDVPEEDGPPALRNFDEFDDVDIDELLGESSGLDSSKTPPPVEEIAEQPAIEEDFGGIDVEPSTIDSGSENPFGDIGHELGIHENTQQDDKDIFSQPDDGGINFDEPALSDDSFSDFNVNTDTDTIPSVEEDPFANLDNLGDSPKTVEDDDDPFGSVDDMSSMEDPFANMGFEEPVADEPIKTEEPEVIDEADPFGSFDAETPAAADDEDPFGSFGGQSDSESDPFSGLDESPVETDSESSSEDPFAGFDTNASVENVETGDDPFASFGDNAEPADIPSEDDPFGGFNEVADDDQIEPMSLSEHGVSDTTDDDPFASLKDDSLSTSDDDPFSGFDEDSPATSKQDFSDTGMDDFGGGLDDLGSTPPHHHDDHDHFADFEPSTSMGDFGDGPDTTLGELDESDSSDSSGYDNLDEDLQSLGEQQEEEEEQLSDEELAVIQQEILNYPPKLKRTVIDVISNDRLSKKDQRELVELIKSSQKPEVIAGYLTEKLGYDVELYDQSGSYSERGIPIIATKPIYTKEGELRRRQVIKRTALLSAAAVLLIGTIISSYKYIIRPMRASTHYNDGLEKIKKARLEPSVQKRTTLIGEAEEDFKKGEEIEPNNLEFLNKYGVAYLKTGRNDLAFEKLFGKVEPDFGMASDKDKLNSWADRVEVPYITLVSKGGWDSKKLPIGFNKEVPDNEKMKLMAQDKQERRIVKAGAYIVARLEKNVHDKTTYNNLGRFHSNIANQFVNPKGGETKYKNDNLAISYYKLVLTDGEEPHNVEATAGIAKVYYNQKRFAKSVYFYNKIVEKFPTDPIGHGGLLSNYIEMWKKDKNPQFVLNHHRQVRNALGIEDDLSLFILTKLTSFYIELNPSEVKIKYNINPEDQVTGMDIDDNVEHLLNLAFFKTEKNQEGEEVKGDEYAEGYYQRGRFLVNKGESIQALKQFELAATNDPAHYLAVLEMAEHYMRLENYSESKSLLDNSLKRFNHYRDHYGARDEDETLLNGEPGRIYFDLGKINYIESALLSGSDKLRDFPDRKVYPNKSIEGKLSEEEQSRRLGLYEAMRNFDKAIQEGFTDPKLRREIYYYRGWIKYIHSQWEDAIEEWSNLSEEDTYSNINVMMARAHSFYRLNQLNASLGNYMKIKEDYEEKESVIAFPSPEESSHMEIYNVLIATYNNIGAIYEIKGNSAEALKHYWRSIEVARKINMTTELASYNKDMVFKKKGGDGQPLLDDWLSPTIDTVKELQNTKKGRL